MKLLIVTQTVDKNDSSLGFFHAWLAEFAERFEKITVIALGVGSYDLPKNVDVYSLGKERARGGVLKRFWYSLRFYQLIYQYRSSYDAVFVHMNEEYVLLAGLFWKLLGKNIYFWRNHPNGSLRTKIAVALADRVFCVSDFAYVSYSSKTRVMPAGIDMTMFTDTHSDRIQSVLSLGRLSPVKKIETIIGAFAPNSAIKLHIYGSAPARDRAYGDHILELVRERHMENVVMFSPGVPYSDTARIYNRHEAYVNATPTGSFDKAILEAAACGCIPIISNKSFEGKLPPECLFRENDSEDLARAIRALFAMNQSARSEIRTACQTFVREEQSLTKLMTMLSHEITS